VSKWYLVSAALDRGLFPLAAVLLLGSVLAVAYVWKVVEPAYFQSAPENRTVKPEPWSLVVPAWVLIGASVYFGVDASLSSSMVHQAAELLLGF
jgi:multicomponent Na+:H+ antiporter subunit D